MPNGSAMEYGQPGLGQVTRGLRTLQIQIDNDYERLNQLREKKGQIIERLKELRVAASDKKNARDEKNRLIAEKKALRDQLHSEKSSISEKIKDLKAKTATILSNVHESEDELVRQFKEASWKYQTTTLTIDEDRRMVQRITELEKKLVHYKRAREVGAEIRSLRSQFNALREKANTVHREIISLADESKKHHEELIKCYEEGRALVAELNRVKEEMQTLREGIAKSKASLFDVRGQLVVARNAAMQQKAEMLAEKAKLLITRRTELAEKANEKLRKGGRLTFEEFGALLEEKGGPDEG